MRERARKRTRAAGCWLGARARSHLLQLVACDVGTQVAHEERRLVQGPAHLQGPDWRDAWQGLQVQFRLGSRRGIRAEHGHEAEAAGHVVVIEEDLALDKLAVRCEQRCEITGRKRLGEPVHEERRVAPDPDGSGGGLHRMGARHRARANPRRSAARSPGATLQPHKRPANDQRFPKLFGRRTPSWTTTSGESYRAQRLCPHGRCELDIFHSALGGIRARPRLSAPDGTWQLYTPLCCRFASLRGNSRQTSISTHTHTGDDDTSLCALSHFRVPTVRV
jgi:hypothetical protein